MFSKISRYKKLNDVVTTDARDRSLESKSMRMLPEVSGTFLHTLEEVDRLDHLAFKYYKQPRKWWRICDANPQFMSPRTLLGKEPIVTTRFPVTYNSNDEKDQPPWYKIIKRLSQIPGVQDVFIEESGEAVRITYNSLNSSAAKLMEILEHEGFNVGEPVNIGRIGKKIIIPPDFVG